VIVPPLFDPVPDVRWHGMAPERHAALERGRAIVHDVCALFFVDAGQVYGPRRNPDITSARHAAAYALYLTGLSKADIGRLLGRDHSTICNSIFRAQHDPALLQAASDCACPSLARAWARSSCGVPAGTRAAIAGYLLALEGGSRVGAHAYRGLVALAGDPALRVRAARALQAAHLENHTWRIHEHALQAGVRWVA